MKTTVKKPSASTPEEKKNVRRELWDKKRKELEDNPDSRARLIKD